MKRIRQCMLFLLVLVLCGGLWIRSNRLYFSPEAAFHGAERGLRYGPSEEILLTYPSGDGSQIYVGKWNNGLSVIPVEQYLRLFWRMSTGVSVEGYHTLYGDVDAMLTEENMLVGLSLLPEVTEVTCLFYSMEDEGKYRAAMDRTSNTASFITFIASDVKKFGPIGYNYQAGG